MSSPDEDIFEDKQLIQNAVPGQLVHASCHCRIIPITQLLLSYNAYNENQ